MSLVPFTKSLKRSEGPGVGPTRGVLAFSTGPVAPVWPEWLKYGPIETITGVLPVTALGRRMSAWRFTSPFLMVAWLQTEPGGGAAAEHSAGTASGAASTARVAMSFLVTEALNERVGRI